MQGGKQMKKKITRVLFSLGMAMSLFATQIGGALIVEASAQDDINFEFIMDDGNSIDGEDGTEISGETGVEDSNSEDNEEPLKMEADGDTGPEIEFGDSDSNNGSVFQSDSEIEIEENSDTDAFDAGEKDAIEMYASYNSNWRYWNQCQSDDYYMRKWGCAVVAQAKLLYETGVDRSSTFNPDSFFVWERNNGYAEETTYQLKTGYAPTAYASQKGKNLEYLGNWNSDANQLWFNINAGYYTIVKVPGHYVYLDNEKSKATGQLYCDDSSDSTPFNSPQPLSRYSSWLSCYVYRSNGNGGGAVDSGISTSWSEWEDNVTETNACIFGKIDVSQRVQFTGAGVSIWDDAGNLIHQSSEGTSVNYNYMQISYNLQTELGVTLSPGRNYTYQMFADFGGQRYYGNKKTFKTAGQSNKVPIGNVDIIEGRDEAVYVRGWAFDPDTVNSSLSIDIYIGGEFVQRITADQERTDVEKAFGGVGNFHGFDAVINTKKTGNQTVDVWALDTNPQGQNIKIGSGNADITIDTEIPEVKVNFAYVGDGIISYEIEVSDKSKTKVKFINDSVVYPHTIYETDYSMQKIHRFTFDTQEITRKSTYDLWCLKLIVEDESGNKNEIRGMNWTDVYDMTKVQRIVLLKGGNNYLLDELSPKEEQPYYITYAVKSDIAKVENYEIIPNSVGVTWLASLNIKTGKIRASWGKLIEVVDKEQVYLNKEYAELYTVGDTVQLAADVTPINVTDKSVTWSSSDEKIATVSKNGLVTAKGEGCVDIIATSKINNVQAVCRVNIKDTQQRSNGGTVNAPTVKVPTGSLNLNSILLKERQKTNVLKVSGLATGDYIKSYSSSNKKVFTVSSGGKITAKKKGTATLTVTLASGKQLKAKVKVQKGTVKISKISVKERSVSLKKGKKYQIKASVSPLTSQEKVIYSTSNKKIATVDKKGKVVAKKKGKAVITVKSGKKKIKVKITVK